MFSSGRENGVCVGDEEWILRQACEDNTIALVLQIAMSDSCSSSDSLSAKSQSPLVLSVGQSQDSRHAHNLKCSSFLTFFKRCLGTRLFQKDGHRTNGTWVLRLLFSSSSPVKRVREHVVSILRKRVRHGQNIQSLLFCFCSLQGCCAWVCENREERNMPWGIRSFWTNSP
jgi:hypothetical protein